MIIDIFEKQMLLNKLDACSSFYNVSMNEKEKVLGLSSGIQQIDGTLKSLGVIIEDYNMAMELLNGLPGRFYGLINVLHELLNDERLFTLDFMMMDVRVRRFRISACRFSNRLILCSVLRLFLSMILQTFEPMDNVQ